MSTHSAKYTITAYSTALFSTWINVEELNLLVDAGDGVTSGLLQKARKIKNVFITHPDRDHLHGLPQFVQLNTRDKFPIIHYPKDAGSFPAMNQFLRKFDPHIEASTWIGIEDGARVAIKQKIFVEAMRNEHVKSEIGVHKSLSYKVFEQRHKLKEEFLSRTSSEIQQLVKERGKESITEISESNIISFSGDTPVDDYGKWDGSEILLHEATFLHQADAKIKLRGNVHSRLDEVVKMVSEIRVGTLILTHFSIRYSREEIDEAVRKLLKKFNIQIPVFVVYPGEIKRDILRTTPINQ